MLSKLLLCHQGLSGQPKADAVHCAWSGQAGGLQSLSHLSKLRTLELMFVYADQVHTGHIEQAANGNLTLRPLTPGGPILKPHLKQSQQQQQLRRLSKHGTSHHMHILNMLHDACAHISPPQV